MKHSLFFGKACFAEFALSLSKPVLNPQPVEGSTGARNDALALCHAVGVLVHGPKRLKTYRGSETSLMMSHHNNLS